MNFLEKHNISTLVDLLRHRAETQPDKTAYIFLVDGENEEVSLSYGELDRQSRAIAAELQKRFEPGERALLLYPPGLEFISAFFGCLYAGIIAVPCYPPDPNKLDVSIAKLRGIIVDCSPKVILTTKEFLDLAAFIFPDYPDLENMNWLASDKVDIVLAGDWKDPDIDETTLAFLQYTSGSTGDPKGVMVSHGNLMRNNEILKQAFGHTEQSIGVGWLPIYHDMGLIGKILQPMCLGVCCVLMSPISFLRKPVRWLRAISKYKATTSGGPNFAYDLCVSKVTPEQLSSLDLSNWEVAFSGAEPVRIDTLKRFNETFKTCGFNPKNFYPCYGLAEATLAVSGGLKKDVPVIENVDKYALKRNKVIFCEAGLDSSQAIVGCGRAWLNHKIIIVDPETKIKRPNNQVGEIWVSGSSVTQGYWNKPELTKETFQAYLTDTGEGPFLRTGDLGFMKDSELFVTGRLKDLIIIRGRNHYPQDIELTVEQSHEFLRSGCGAAFSVEVEKEERLVVVQEVKPKGIENLNTNKIIQAIRKAVADRHELWIYTVVLIESGTIPKTSSGKIQRKFCRQMFLKGDLKTLREDVLKSPDPASDEDLARKQAHSNLNLEDLTREISADKRRARLLHYLQTKLAEILKTSTSEINPAQDLISFGMDSLQLIELKTIIDESLKTDFDLITLIKHEAGLNDYAEAMDEALLKAPYSKSLNEKQIEEFIL